MRRAQRTALAVASLVAVAAMADPNGIWIVSMQTPAGERTNELTITPDDTGHTATISSPRGTRELGEVQVDGDNVGFVARIDTPAGGMEMVYSARVEGDTMTGTVRTPRGERPFTANVNELKPPDKAGRALSRRDVAIAHSSRCVALTHTKSSLQAARFC